MARLNQFVNWRVGDLVNSIHQLTNSPTHQFTNCVIALYQNFTTAPSWKTRPTSMDEGWRYAVVP
jgi:hypothetical protein